MIPIYIPSYGRAKTIKTTKYLDDCSIPYKVLLHSETDKAEYLRAGIVRAEDIIVTNALPGITNQRNYLMDNLAVKGEWFITLDDNISGFNRVVDKYYFDQSKLDVNDPTITQADFSQPVEADEFVELVKYDIETAERYGIHYGGFATVSNYFFNSKKYRLVGYVISKAAYIKYDGTGYDKNIKAMDDYGFTASSLLKDGAVLINSWIKSINKHYEPGGIGTYDQRVERKIHDAAYLMSKYPGLFRYKVKKGCHPKAEIQVRFTSTDQVKKWRRELHDATR